MHSRRRLVTAIAGATAAALVGALGTGFTVAGFASTNAQNGGVTATFGSAVAQLVAHYTVAPSGGFMPRRPHREATTVSCRA